MQAWLAKAQQPSRVWHVWLPVFEPVRAEPEFKLLIRDLGLVEYWRRHGWPEFCRPIGDDDFACR